MMHRLRILRLTVVFLCMLNVWNQVRAIPYMLRQTGAWSSCSDVSGVCIDTNVYTCSTSTLTNKCPGASNIRCCPYPGGLEAGSCFSDDIGLCTRTENCPRTVITGICPGPSGITCCLNPNPLNSPAPTSQFVPPAPNTSDNMGICTTPYDSLDGYCINRSKCTGGTFNGLCPGSSQILCCVTETRPTSAVPNNPPVSQEQFDQLFTNISPTRAAALYPYFLSSLSFASINNCLRIAAFSAQVAHESLGLLYFEELSDGTQYEGRESLGNTEPGDGPRFKGRGPMQLTGRFNYGKAGMDLGRTFVENPEQVGMPSGGFEAAAWFWRERVSNADADAGTQTGFDRITVAINGCSGVITNCNGVEDRRSRWNDARTILGC